MDGVFIPDGGMGGDDRVVIASTGLRVSLPDTTGEAYNVIHRGVPTRRGPIREQTLGSVDYGRPGHSILCMAGNQGVTFDLAAIRTAHKTSLERFTAVAGNAWIGPAAFYIFLDGVLVAQHSGIIRDLDQPAANTFPLDIPIPATARFLTLVTADDKDNPRYYNTVPPTVHIEQVLVDGGQPTRGCS